MDLNNKIVFHIYTDLPYAIAKRMCRQEKTEKQQSIGYTIRDDMK